MLHSKNLMGIMPFKNVTNKAELQKDNIKKILDTYM